MKTLNKIAVGLIIVLGLVHIGYTFGNYATLSMDAMWFAGAGVAVVFAGFLNIAMLRDGGRDRVTWVVCIIANVVMLVMFVALAYVLRQSQAYVGMFLFTFTTIHSIFANSEKSG